LEPGNSSESQRPPLSRPAGKFAVSDLRIDTAKRRRRRGGWFKWLIILLLFAGAGIGAFAFWKGRAPEVTIAEARKQTKGAGAISVLNASGYVTPRRRSTVAAKITGRLNQVLVEEGMRVAADQVLATLDDTDIKVRIASAEAERSATQASLADLRVGLKNAEREFTRQSRLHEEGISTKQAIDAAEIAVESFEARINSVEEQIKAAEARIQVARQDLENTVIRAPFGGIVVTKDAQRGEMVSPVSGGGGFTRTGIATVVDMSSLEIEVDVNESYITRVREGQPVNATLDAYPDWTIPGRVRTVIPTADRQKATIKVRIAFEKLDPRIIPDMGVKVAFLEEKKSGESAPVTVLLVPSEAVKDDGGQPVVYVLRDNLVERRAVKVAQQSAGQTSSDASLLAGVSDGEKVVVSSSQPLQDGMTVKVKEGT
jgi:RND family efflux transporter MFP subunit